MNNYTRDNLVDKHLVNKILGGDTYAFTQIIKDTEKLVAQIVFKMVDNPEDRKDIAQDIYLKVYKNLATFKFESKLSTWIAQIGYNKCYDYLRKKKMVVPLMLDEVPGQDDDIFDSGNISYSNNGAGVADIIHQKELSSILSNEIGKLPPVYHTLITLYHQEELSYDEIGQITGLPSGTVKNYLFRARKTLKNGLLANFKMEDL